MGVCDKEESARLLRALLFSVYQLTLWLLQEKTWGTMTPDPDASGQKYRPNMNFYILNSGNVFSMHKIM